MILLAKQLREILAEESVHGVNFSSDAGSLQLSRGECGTPIKTIVTIIGLKNKLTKDEREVVCEQFKEWVYSNKGVLETYLADVVQLQLLELKISDIKDYEASNVYVNGFYTPGVRFSKHHTNYSSNFLCTLYRGGFHLSGSSVVIDKNDKVNIQLSILPVSKVKAKYPAMFKVLDLFDQVDTLRDKLLNSKLNKSCNLY